MCQIKNNELLECRKNKLIYYSHYSFLRANHNLIFDNILKPKLISLLDNNECNIEVLIEGYKHYFLVEYLAWDSKYFNISTFKLINVLFDHDDYSILKKAVNNFTEIFLLNKDRYCFIEIPSEDNLLIQALNESQFKLVETRMTYFLDLKKFANDRYQTRRAELSDIKNLKRISFEMRNPYDRFHSDSNFSPEAADNFLGVFAEESIKGFADYVMVPNEDGVPPDAFVTAKYLNQDWELIGNKVSKMVLSAVSDKTCKGWYIKLISEMAYHLSKIGAEYSIMHPASTNKAVIHTYEKLGCKLGQITHILSYL